MGEGLLDDTHARFLGFQYCTLENGLPKNDKLLTVTELTLSVLAKDKSVIPRRVA
jgi:hypothetical protein